MEISRHWRIRKQRYSMTGGICPSCETKSFPAREVCPVCGYSARYQEQAEEQAVVYAQPLAMVSRVTNA